MEPTPQTVLLLSEIRDLLVMAVDVNFDAYASVILKRLGPKADDIRSAVNTDKQWVALSLMRGDKSQKEIAAQTGIDPGALSRFVTKIKALGVLQDGERGPLVRLSEFELRALRHGVSS